MREAELKAILANCLGDLLHRERGQILYSGIDTLKPGDFYFLGFNPAKDGTNPALSALPFDRHKWSAYVDQCWYCGSPTGCRKAGERLHQRQVRRTMKEDLRLIPEETFATNLIFVESHTAKEIYSESLREICWGVHKKLLAKIRPKCIVCLGNGEDLSAFSVLRKIAKDKTETKTQPASNGTFKGFAGTFDLGDGNPLKPKVVGVRHPSRPMKTTGLRNFIASLSSAP
jgi:hypothetical protein